MAITTTDSNPATLGWIANANSADLSGTEIVKAAPASGTNLLLERLVISSGGAITVTIGEGETSGAVTTIIWGPVHMAANSQIEKIFNRPVKLTAATALMFPCT